MPFGHPVPRIRAVLLFSWAILVGGCGPTRDDPKPVDAKSEQVRELLPTTGSIHLKLVQPRTGLISKVGDPIEVVGTLECAVVDSPILQANGIIIDNQILIRGVRASNGSFAVDLKRIDEHHFEFRGSIRDKLVAKKPGHCWISVRYLGMVAENPPTSQAANIAMLQPVPSRPGVTQPEVELAYEVAP